MSSNRVTLAQARDMDAKGLSSLPPDLIAILLEDVAAHMADAKRMNDRMNEALAIKYGQIAHAVRMTAKKDSGRVHLVDGEYMVHCDLAKKVDWDQTMIADAIKVIQSWGENPSEYVQTKVVVPENRWNAWPQKIRDVFASARTVGVGRPTFSLEQSI